MSGLSARSKLQRPNRRQRCWRPSPESRRRDAAPCDALRWRPRLPPRRAQRRRQRRRRECLSARVGRPGGGGAAAGRGGVLRQRLLLVRRRGAADREFVIGGNLMVDLEATIAANFATVLWV